MREVKVALKRAPYRVLIGCGTLGEIGAVLGKAPAQGRAAVLGDEFVVSRYGAAVQQSLEQAGYSVVSGTQPSGEEHKTLDTAARYYSVLLRGKLERSSPVIAMGGGVAGDTAGFAAATYLRGVPLIHCPTTLLAMVDSSIGGKVGVNLPEGKNLVGSFHQPQFVLIDLDTLATLPERELRSGLAECVKHAVIRDAELFSWLEHNSEKILTRETAVLEELVERNVAIKAAVITEDEREADVRAHLNFGHTFAHAIEKTAGYGAMLHGEAVSLGMVAATALAIRLGRSEPQMQERLSSLLTKLGLPVKARLSERSSLTEAIAVDKKVQGGMPRFIIPDGLGAASIVSGVELKMVEEAWDQIDSGRS